MFLDRLNEKQQRIFFQAAQLLVGSDGKYDRREAHHLESIKAELTLGETPLAANSVEEIVSELGAFDRPLVRNILVFELVGIAMADATVQDAEAAVLTVICAALGVPEGRIELYRDFAVRMRELRDEAFVIITAE